MDSRSTASLSWLDHDSRAVAKHFRHTLHDFGCIVAQTDDCIRAEPTRVIQHLVEGVLPRFLAKISQDRDIAADYRLQSCADCAENRAGTHDDASNHAEILHNPVAG